MNIESYLIISRKGSVDIRKTRPKLSSDEVALRLNINLPNNFFDRMIPAVDINVPKEAIWEPNAELSLKLTAEQVSAALDVEFNEVLDGLREIIKNKETIKPLQPHDSPGNKVVKA